MTFEKALRILPTFALHLTKGQTELPELRSRVQGYRKILEDELMEEIGRTHSQSFRTPKVLEIDRKMQQLERFLEQTQ